MKDTPLNREIALESRRLSVPTQDPGDRFIAATARLYELTLVTDDGNLLGLNGVTILSNRAIST